MADTHSDDSPAAHHATKISELEQQSATASRLFDVRTVIGGLFLVYGLLIGGAGLFADAEALAKAQGININLWTGLAMLALGVVFMAWLKLRPLAPPPRTGGDQD